MSESARVGRGRGARVAAATATAAALAAGPLACQGDGGDMPGSGDGELRVLAGSELADLEPLLEAVEAETGVTVNLDYTGTLDGAQRIVSGVADEDYDAVWFSSNRYLNLHPDGRAALRAETPVMASPVVLAVTAATADDLGWDGAEEVTWADVADAVDDGDLRYGMTNPAASNSGFSALVGVAAALADTGAALEDEDIDAVTPRLREFFAGQRLTAGSSGWLAEEFVDRAGPADDSAVNGLINYESVLLSLNDSGRLDEPLVIVHPADGAVTADYPLSLLDSATDEAAADYDAVVEHLLSPTVQREIMAATHRRPMAAEVTAEAEFPAVTELPFPARAEVADRLVAAYLDEIRRPPRTIYVLDVSSSMEGERIDGLREAMRTLTGGDSASLSGQFQRFYGRERVTLVPFDGQVRDVHTFEVPATNPDTVLDDIRTTVEELELGPLTAGYDALTAAYAILTDEAAAGDDAEDGTEPFVSIVLMTDGEVNEGLTFEAFRDEVHAELPADLRQVPIFPVLFGESETTEMTALADLTGGRAFDARGDSLDEAFREIRGYQ